MNRGYLILFALLACSFCPTEEVAVKGHLRSKSHKRVSNVVIFVKGAIENGLGATTTDKNGDFILGFDDWERTKPLLFYYVNEGRDTILLKSVMKLKNDMPEMTFWIK